MSRIVQGVDLQQLQQRKQMAEFQMKGMPLQIATDLFARNFDLVLADEMGAAELSKQCILGAKQHVADIAIELERIEEEQKNAGSDSQLQK